MSDAVPVDDMTVFIRTAATDRVIVRWQGYVRIILDLEIHQDDEWLLNYARMRAQECADELLSRGAI